MKSVADLNIKYTGGSFKCGHKQLTSLKGSPTAVGGYFDCSNNQLTSLEGAPRSVGGDFYCDNNLLTSLQGAPTKVGGGFYCNNNRLTSLDGAPTKVGGDFYCQYNKLTSLKSVHRIIHEIGGIFVCSGNKLEHGYLYILLIKGVTRLLSDFKAADVIVNRYLKSNPSGSMKAVLEVQALLEEADVEYPR